MADFSATKKATVIGQFQPNTFMRQETYKRLCESNVKRLHRNAVKAVESARAIADIKHERVYIAHINHQNWLFTRDQMNYFKKNYDVELEFHTVRPSYEGKHASDRELSNA